MTTAQDADIQLRLETEPDFIALKRFDFSLKELEKRYPDGCPDHIIAAALNLTEEEVQTHHNRIVQELRAKMGVKDDQ